MTAVVRRRPADVRDHASTWPACRCRPWPTWQLVGTPVVGDVVLLNTNALDLDLGTGGHAMVVALPDRLPRRHSPGRAHRQGALHPAAGDGRQRGRAGVGAPRRCSPRPTTWPGSRWSSPICTRRCRRSAWRSPPIGPATRVVYVMTDGGALADAATPVPCRRCASAGLLAGTVTAGQAYGGDHEAVNVHSALLVARLGAGGGHHRGHAGAGQPGHRHPVGLLGRSRR